MINNFGENMIENLKLVNVDKIPKGESVPLDNLENIWNTFKQMEFICVSNNGCGLSAVQVGIPWKSFVVINENGTCDYFLNCEYNGIGKKKESIEGCLSLRNAKGNLLKFKVERFKKIIFYGKQIIFSENKFKIISFSRIIDGINSIIYQHEIDHQRLILISDIGIEMGEYDM